MMKHIMAVLMLLILVGGCAPATRPTPPTTSMTTPPTNLPPPTAIEKDWIRYNIQDVGSLDYPPNFLELQSGDYKRSEQEMNGTIDLPTSDFILQQVGLNELNPAALKEYRRVMFRTVYLKPDETVFSHHEKYASSRQELAEIQNEWVDQSLQGFAQQKSKGLGDNKFVDPGSLEIVEVNGMFPMLWTYKRQLNENPVVLVKEYLLFNYDKIHRLIFSCRVEDEKECRAIYEKILYSFKLQN